MRLKYYTDPGHGWVAVKRSVIEQFDLTNVISSYSYQLGNTVYLEEDCDAFALATALKNKGIAVEYIMKSSENRSPIRNYKPYKPM